MTTLSRLITEAYTPKPDVQHLDEVYDFKCFCVDGDGTSGVKTEREREREREIIERELLY